MPSLRGECFVILGLSRLTVRVSRLIVERGGEVTVIIPDDASAPSGDGALASSLPEAAHVVRTGDMESALGEATPAGTTCFLALADDDLANLAAAVTCHALQPDVPVVLRTYDITLADKLEEGLNIRRAYSVSALAAPAFLAAGLGSRVVETLRLGETQVPIWESIVVDGSPVAGRSAQDAGPAAGVRVLGLRESNGSNGSNGSPAPAPAPSGG